MLASTEPPADDEVLTVPADHLSLTCIAFPFEEFPRRGGQAAMEERMQDPHTVPRDRAQRQADRDPMLAVLGGGDSVTDAEAFAILRRRFPETSLCERVAAVARWRSG